MRTSRFCLILCSSLFAGACTKATPDFALLDESKIPQPTFAGNVSTSINTSSDSTTYVINGECDPKIRNIQGTVRGQSGDLSNVAVSVSITCSSDGKFSFELKSLAALGFTPQEGDVIPIELRGETSAGKSRPSTISLNYSKASGGHRPTLVTSGSTVHSTGTGLTATIRVSNRMNNYSGANPASAEDSFLKTDGHGISAQIGVRMNQ